MKKTYGSTHISISEVETSPLRVDHDHNGTVAFRLIDDAGVNIWFTGTPEDWRTFATYVSQLADRARPKISDFELVGTVWVDRADFEESRASDEVTS